MRIAATDERARSLVHVERAHEREGATVDVALMPEIAARMRRLGIGGLWSHQAAALTHVRAGRNVAIATGTASGKSLVYQIALAERLAAGRGATGQIGRAHV